MSFHRENVVWQSKDGTWSRGVFDTTWVGSESDGYDPEWDVEYDFSKFSWVSTGHATMDKAVASWDGVNLGGFASYESYEDNPKEHDEYDRMAAECKQRDRERGYRIHG